MKLNVYSEIGRLKTVMLHRPGYEVENLTPNTLERLLFDDIPYLEVARKEHDYFADILRNNGTEVLYLENLVAESLENEEVKMRFIDEFIEEASLESKAWVPAIKDFYLSFPDNKSMIDKMIAGIKKTELKLSSSKSLYSMASSTYPLVVDPMPNLYFTRDPFATIGTGVALNKMRTVTRNRETLFAKYVFDNHPMFKQDPVKLWYNRDYDFSLEGGDTLILSDKVLAVGISLRTDADAIEELAKNLFSSGESFDTVLAFDIPATRAFMHLDTVFTMVDYDKFTIHPAIEGPLTVFKLKKLSDAGDYTITEETQPLEVTLAEALDLDSVELIRCGGDSPVDSDREQWNDGSNTLAIAPGEVIVYDRNYVTNEILEQKGIKLRKMGSSELSRGRGGPRCMSMPFVREALIKK